MERRPPQALVRGQTSLDYLLGMSLFLLSLAFVFGFVPGMFAPFGATGASDTLVADRAADRVAADLLVASPTQPAVLNRSCTVGFFDADGVAPAGCRYDDAADGAALGAALGTAPTTGVNVTIESGGTVVTLDGVRLAAGGAPAEDVQVTTATRVVRVAGGEHLLVVRVW